MVLWLLENMYSTATAEPIRVHKCYVACQVNIGHTWHGHDIMNETVKVRMHLLACIPPGHRITEFNVLGKTAALPQGTVSLIIIQT